MLLSARRIAADEAYAKGLVSRLLPLAGFHDAALAYAVELAQGAPSSFALIKRQLGDASGEDFETARANAAELARETLHGSDFGEALAAKREGRPARFAPVTATFAPPISES